MKKLNALYFPDTAINTAQAGQELLFFDKIYHYLPAEKETDSGAAELCHGYAPVPFHNDLQRFEQLIRELKGNEAEFYSGMLSSLTLEYLESRNEATVRNLISTISGKTGTTTQKPAEPNNREDLWQARLLLRLAEILNDEEQSLQKELAAIAHKERSLFDTLKGEPDISFSLAQMAADTRSPVKLPMLVKAWAKLFLEDTTRMHSILTCAQEEAMQLLFDANEALSNQFPTRLLRIPLPDIHGMEMATYAAARASFRDEAQETLAGITSLLDITSVNGITEGTLKDFTSLAAQWTKLFAASGPWGSQQESPPAGKKCQGAPHLEVYLGNCSLAELLAHSSRTKIPRSQDTGNRLAILALKSTKKSTCTG